MLTAKGCSDRRLRLWDALPAEYEWVLIADPRHVQYFANFWVNLLSFSTSERGLLLLERHGKATLFADNMTFRSKVAEPCVDALQIGQWYDHKQSVMNRDHVLFRQLQPFNSRLHAARGLVEGEWLPVTVCDELDLGIETRALELGSIIRQLRRQKCDDEIALLERCMRACEAGHRRALEFIQPGVTDLDVYLEVQRAAQAEAGLPCVVYGDFRSVSAATPKRGNLPVNEVLNEHDLFILDYSVVIGGYRSDFTNTLAVGAPSADQVEIFDTVQMALSAAEKQLAVGVRASDIYAAASNLLTSAGHLPLAHHCGHGLGLGHPEAPILVSHSADVLMHGDVITLEPGLYVEGIGGVRLEHNYLIADSGVRRLSQHELRLR